MKSELKLSIFLAVVALIFGFYAGRYFQSLKIPVVVEYSCSGKKAIGVQYYKEKVHIGLSDDREYTLKKAESISGDRYTNGSGSIVFWSKDDGVFFQEGSLITYSDCLEAGK